jgi:hypothetical protein
MSNTNCINANFPAHSYEFSASHLEAMIHALCSRDDLSCYDPYDIWKTPLGFRVKHLFNCRPCLGLLPAATFALLDSFANEKLRLFYSPMEYPIVRAFAVLCLLNLYDQSPDPRFLTDAERHLKWLLNSSCRGYRGYCWGLGFAHAVSSTLVYHRKIPFTTITAYGLEAFVRFSELSSSTQFQPVIESIFRFFHNDVQIMEEDEETLATSYGPFRDRTVTNAVSYTMYAYALFYPYAGQQQEQIKARIRKLYAYIQRHQRADGSWYYSPHGRSFVDCFHSCIVLKNIIKSDRIIKLNDSATIVAAGYEYLITSFLDKRHLLFKRFSVSNKVGLVRFDLYDNAEALNLALLLGDFQLAQALMASVVKHFCRGSDIYSQIHFLGGRKCKNTYRWAVMPFLYAISQMLQQRNPWTA